MYRIGIIGCENSHANGFADLFNEQKKYEGFKVTAVSGHYADANRALAEKYGIAGVYEDFRDMAGKVDAVMITARDGKYHAEFALPFVKAGLPVFVDKPFTVDAADGKKLIAEAERSGSPLCGGSSLKYLPQVRELKEIVEKGREKGEIRGGTAVAPLLFDSEYSGFYFYASHLAEISMEIFGKTPLSVYAVRTGKDISVLTEYKDYCVSNHFGNLAVNSYFAGVIATEKNYLREIDISEGLALETDIFVRTVTTGKSLRPAEELIVPIKYMNAIVQSYTEKKKIAFDKAY